MLVSFSGDLSGIQLGHQSASLSVTCLVLILLIAEWSICHHYGLLFLALLHIVFTSISSFITPLGINLCDLRVTASLDP
jgi:hypothetical protein